MGAARTQTESQQPYIAGGVARFGTPPSQRHHGTFLAVKFSQNKRGTKISSKEHNALVAIDVGVI